MESTLYDEKRTLVDKYNLLELQNQCLQKENDQLQSALISIQQYVNEMSVNCPFAMIKSMKLKIADIVLTADHGIDRAETH